MQVIDCWEMFRSVVFSNGVLYCVNKLGQAQKCILNKIRSQNDMFLVLYGLGHQPSIGILQMK